MHKLYSYFFQAQTTKAYSILRIYLGGFCLYSCLELYREGVSLNFSSNGWLSDRPGIVPSLINSLPAWSAEFSLSLLILSSVGIILGIMPRATLLIHFLIKFIWILYNPTLFYSADKFLQFAILFLYFTPCGNHYSIGKTRIFGRRNEEVKKTPTESPKDGLADNTTCSRLPLRMIQLHLVLGYLIAGLSKATGDDWYSGDSLALVLSHPLYARFDYSFLAQVPFIEQIFIGLGLFTISWQITYPALYTFSYGRIFVCMTSVAFHLSIAVLFTHSYFGLFFAGINFIHFPSESVRLFDTFLKRIKNLAILKPMQP